MRKTFMIYLFEFILGGLSNGFLMCVASVALLSRGLSLSEIALGMTVQAIAAVALEVPSGMLSDLWNRKKVWLLSKVVLLVAMILYLFGQGSILFLAFLLNGISNALDTGTLDAIYLERWIDCYGNNTIAKANLWAETCRIGSQAVGAILGGLLSNIKFGRPYTLNLLLCSVLLGLMLLSGALLPADEAQHSVLKQPIRTSFFALLSNQIKTTVQTALNSPSLLICIVGTIPISFVISGIEIYWQPYLETWNTGTLFGVLLGLLSCGSMLGAVLGNFLAAFLLRRIKPLTLFFSVLAFGGICLGGMIFAGGPLVFSGSFLLYEVSFSTGMAVNTVIVQSAVSNQIRGTVMSGQNLLAEGGATLAQMVSAGLLLRFSISQLWTFQLFVFGAALLLLLRYKRFRCPET